MLVTFHTRSYRRLVFFGDVAKDLLKKMGQSGQIPGGMRPEDVPAALAKLESALADEPTDDAAAAGGREDADANRVGIRTRAVPLIKLLKAAARDEAYVMWTD